MRCGDVYDPNDESFADKCVLPAGHDADRKDQSEPIVHSNGKGGYWYSTEVES